MVRSGSIAADIGTDHAYLPAWLILNNVCPSALACDVRKGPLDNARKTVESYGIENRITLRLSDGFDEIRPDEAQDFIMCGMGGTLMEELVSRTEWLKDKSKRLIVQPQSHSEDIRRFFVQNGFEILLEDACTDGGKLYCAMAAEYTGKITEKPISYIYSGKLSECAKPEAVLIIENTVSRLKTKLDAAKNHGTPENAEYLGNVISELEVALNEIQSDS